MRLLGALAVAMTIIATAAILAAAIGGSPLYAAMLFLGWLVVMVSLGLGALAHEMAAYDARLRK
jgi:hypothetical protein